MVWYSSPSSASLPVGDPGFHHSDSSDSVSSFATIPCPVMATRTLLASTSVQTAVAFSSPFMLVQCSFTFLIHRSLPPAGLLPSGALGISCTPSVPRLVRSRPRCFSLSGLSLAGLCAFQAV